MIAVPEFAFIYYLRSGGAERRHRALSAPTPLLRGAGATTLKLKPKNG
jgi:hypothetical protein